MGSSSWNARLERRHNSVYITLTRESRSAESEKVGDLKSDQLLQEIEVYDLCDIHNID